MNLTKSQIKALTIIVREDGASRATLIEEGIVDRCLSSLEREELVKKSALNVYTLTTLGTKVALEAGVVEWTTGANPRPIDGNADEDAAGAAEIEAEIDQANSAVRMYDELAKNVAKAVKKTQAARAPKAMTECLCGCKAFVKGSFVAGHDARLHGQVIRAKKENAQVVVTERAAAWLMTKPWAVDGYKVSA